jgi:CHAT domain
MWIEIDVETSGDEVRIRGRGARGERLAAHKLPSERGFDALQSLGSKIGRAIRAGKPLDPPVIEVAQALHGDVFQGELQALVTRLSEASKDAPLLVRIFIQDRALAAAPWEALCKPNTSEGFLGTDPKLMVARGVNSSEPWQPREIRGAVRVLAIAPGSDENALTTLRTTLSSSIESGEIEWLDPIMGSSINARVLFDKLRRGKTPHILHFLGHGSVDVGGRPVLRLADDEDGEEVWLTAEAFARELEVSFTEDLRLVILEACEGAKPGALGSAAEVFAKAGADAVVAHLWPVKATTAQICSIELYRSLTGSDRTSGDIGQSIAAARRTLLASSAEAFSPILFLRGSDSIIFDFDGRRIAKPSGKKRGRGLAPALGAILDRPYCLVLGDHDEARDTLLRDLNQFMEDNGDKPDPNASLSAVTQRCLLRFGQEVLHSLFQQALATTQTVDVPPLVDALARMTPPGVHVTLLWRPHLERALADKQPHRTIWAIQPSLGGSNAKPRIVKRLAGTNQWKMEPIVPKRFDTDTDIVILRLYGGYSAEPRPIFSPPMLTEDDHIHGLLGAAGPQLPTWMEELLARPRIHPGLFVGLSVLDWRHRMLLRWLYDQRPAPKDSLVVLSPKTDNTEPEIWESGGGLPGTGRIAAIIEDPTELAGTLESFEPSTSS